MVNGLRKACEKRPVSMATIEEVADRIEHLLQSRGEKEIASAMIGEEIMRELYNLDKVAYVRFASVYRSFQDLDAFMHELKELVDGRGRTSEEEERKSRRRAPGDRAKSQLRDS